MRETIQARLSPSRDGLRLVGGLVALMWLVEVIDAIDSHRLDQYGIEPREADGLLGILFAPFLHAGFGHLIGNTIPFILLGCVIAVRGLSRVAAVTVIVALASGLGTWLIAPAHSVHIGASGVVFGYATYLVSRGLFTRRFIEMAVGAIVAIAFGSALLNGLEPHAGISWQGHLCGGLGGVLAAWLLSGRPRPAGRERPVAA
jgi:membrane associated rhomboid family serine protease